MWKIPDRKKEKDDAIENHRFLKGKYSALIWNITGSQTHCIYSFLQATKHQNCHMAGIHPASNMKENVLAEITALHGKS